MTQCFFSTKAWKSIEDFLWKGAKKTAPPQRRIEKKASPKRRRRGKTTFFDDCNYDGFAIVDIELLDSLFSLL